MLVPRIGDTNPASVWDLTLLGPSVKNRKLGLKTSCKRISLRRESWSRSTKVSDRRCISFHSRCCQFHRNSYSQVRVGERIFHREETRVCCPAGNKIWVSRPCQVVVSVFWRGRTRKLINTLTMSIEIEIPGGSAKSKYDYSADR